MTTGDTGASGEARLKQEVGNLLHELRTLLNGASGFTEMALGIASDRRQLEYLHNALESMRNMTDLMNKILDLGMNGDDCPPNEEALLLRSLVQTYLTTLSLEADKAGVTLHNEVPPTIRLRGDRTRVLQIVGNLTNNAIKYNKPGGSVWVRGAVVQGRIELEVEDTGIGIDGSGDDVFGHRIREHERPEVADKDGYGIGLSLVKNLLHLHGGGITFESIPGKGTIFTAHFSHERTIEA